jgi:hypothetical protein
LSCFVGADGERMHGGRIVGASEDGNERRRGEDACCALRIACGLLWGLMWRT